MSQLQGRSAAERIMSMKTSSDTTGIETSDLPSCGAEFQPTALPRAQKNLYLFKYTYCTIIAVVSANLKIH
jgi:hypothetical protein